MRTLKGTRYICPKGCFRPFGGRSARALWAKQAGRNIMSLGAGREHVVFSCILRSSSPSGTTKGKASGPLGIYCVPPTIYAQRALAVLRAAIYCPKGQAGRNIKWETTALYINAERTLLSRNICPKGLRRRRRQRAAFAPSGAALLVPFVVPKGELLRRMQSVPKGLSALWAYIAQERDVI